MCGSSDLRLRPLRPEDEDAFLRAHHEMAEEGFTFGLGWEKGLPWQGYLRKLEDHRAGVGLPTGWVPDTFLVAEVKGAIVGRTSIRHDLTEPLKRVGGHIGYGVVPEFRRRGYATEILRQSLVVARSIGIDRVLVTCEDDNRGSIAVIETCGGVLDSFTPGTPPIRRYWID